MSAGIMVCSTRKAADVKLTKVPGLRNLSYWSKTNPTEPDKFWRFIICGPENKSILELFGFGLFT